jgi:hypothetical protein
LGGLLFNPEDGGRTLLNFYQMYGFYIAKASKYSSACACTALNMHSFICLLKAGIMKPAETSIPRERLCKRPLLGSRASIVAQLNVAAVT